MINTTKVYSPQFQVRFLTAAGWVMWQTEALRVETQATIRDMVGQWRVTFVERDTKGQDIYDVVEPMLYCEILFQRVNDQLTPVMRGFVTKVRKTLDISSGIPMRVIEVSGQNYGKIILMSYIHYVTTLDAFSTLIDQQSTIPLFAHWGLDTMSGVTSPAQAVTTIFNQLLYPQFKNIKTTIVNRKATVPNPNVQRAILSEQITASMAELQLDVDTEGVDGNREYNLTFNMTDPYLGAAEQSAKELLMKVAGFPWNELFIDDAPEATYMVFRPTPWRDRYGIFVGTTAFRQSFQPSALDTTLYKSPFIEIQHEDVLGFELERSDENVFNYFFTYPTYMQIGNDLEQQIRSANDNVNPHFTVDLANLRDASGASQQALIKTPFEFTDVNGDPKSGDPRLDFSRMELFGFRELRLINTWMSTSDSNAHKKPETLTQQSPKFFRTGQLLNRTAFWAMEHNAQLENGTLIIKGREDIRPGMYVRFKDDRNDSQAHFYYVTDVSHLFTPFESFISRLTVARGEGHLAHTTGKEI